jgi:hypothetical protein
MALFHGIVINFGIGTTMFGYSGLFQSRTHGYKANSEEVKDGGQNTVGKGYFDYHEEAAFTYIPVSPTGGVNAGNLVFGTPVIGTYVTLTDNNNYGQISGLWLVEDVDTNTSNTTAVRVNVKLMRYNSNLFPQI